MMGSRVEEGRREKVEKERDGSTHRNVNTTFTFGTARKSHK